MPAFLYGWALLLVIQSGGMAAVAITFARYFGDLVQLAVRRQRVAVGALALLTAINCLGVRAGSNVQSGLMVLKIARHRHARSARACCSLRQACRSLVRPRTAVHLDARRDRRGADARHVRLWRLADVELRRRRDARSAARPRARPAVRRRRRRHPLHRRSPSSASMRSAPPGLPQSKTPATDVMRLALGDTRRDPDRASASRSRRSASSARAC